MEVRTESKKGPLVESLPEVVVAAIGGQPDGLKDAVRQRLFADFSRFGEIEAEVHNAFKGMADQFVAGLLVEAGKQPQLTEDAKKSHRPSSPALTAAGTATVENAFAGRLRVVAEDFVLWAEAAHWPRPRP